MSERRNGIGTHGRSAGQYKDPLEARSHGVKVRHSAVWVQLPNGLRVGFYQGYVLPSENNEARDRQVG